MEHTKLPFEHNGNAVHKRITERYATCICVCDGDNRQNNAAFIVRACNSHYELLEALEWVAGDPMFCELSEKRQELVQAAIAKAKGEA